MTLKYCEIYMCNFFRRFSLPVLLLTGIICIGLSSCIDEIDYPEGVIPDGETTMIVDMSFTPLVATSLDGASSRSNGMEFGQGNTVAPTGDSMDQISSLYILLYTPGDTDEESKLVSTIPVDLVKYKPTLEDRTDADASNGNSAQAATMCVKNVPLTLQNGTYKMFAVANLDINDKDVSTVDKLRSIRLGWSVSDFSKNSAMLGFFTNGKQETRGNNFEATQKVVVSPRNTSLHAWIRRAVSKLTIDFDGSKLRDNVFVYIKEARVYDIADGCFLGYYSCVGDAPKENCDITTTRGGFGIAKSDHALVYGAGENYEAWPVVTRGQNLDSYELDGKKVNFHDEKAYCLPFYENLQGNGMLKYQDADGDGIIDNPDAGDHTGTGADRVWTHEKAKDSKPNGTYVEVIGYYESRNNDYASGGEIKFRFMLGKNVKDNFDVERNHHYKLTLSFKGNGNDADWHIEYDESQGIHLPTPLYISYLYNKSLTFPIRINTGGKKLKDLDIEITRNDWAPYFDPQNPITSDLDYYEDAATYNENGKKFRELGFLSLLKTSATNIIAPPSTSQPDRLTLIANQYNTATDDDGDGINESTCGKRKYLASPGEHGLDNNGKYEVKYDGNVVEFQIPLYTRAKNLVKETAYTGNNPFFGYPRLAEITVTANFTDGTNTIIKDIPVYQVRRLVNPKGIFRKVGNNTPFHVQLLEKEHEVSENFALLQSIGPWRAYVIAGDAGFIDLDGKTEVGGPTSSYVDFYINFKGATKKNENRFAVVQVEYHNYSCVHQIFIRQGDAPVQMFDKDASREVSQDVYWHTYNMKLKNEEVSDAVDEGSLFRFGIWDYPIDASNQVNSRSPWTKVTPEDFKGIVDKNGNVITDLLIAGTTNRMTWDGISSDAASGGFNDITYTDENGNKITYSLPTAREFQYLRDITDSAFGVLYGDEATGVQFTLESAYEYRRDENGVPNNSQYGMRGCFAYIKDKTSPYYGRHLFFPIGSSGYGHRKHKGAHGGSWAKPENYSGQLRYSAGAMNKYIATEDDLRKDPKAHLYRPLFYDLYMRTGAIYWANKNSNEFTDPDVGIGRYIGLDINYYTFDFNIISDGSVYGDYISSTQNKMKGTSDACFIRCVDRK